MTEAAPLEPQLPAVPPPRFSLVPTVLAAIVVVLFLIFFAFSSMWSNRLEGIEAPERALLLIVSRTMDYEEALKRAPAWERLLHRVLSGGRDELSHAIADYEELVAYSPDRLPGVHLAILEAEAGRIDRVRERTAGLEQDSEPLPAFARLIRAAYHEDGSLPSDTDLKVLEQTRWTLVPGWFFDQLAIRLSRHRGDHTGSSSREQALVARAERLLGVSRLIVWMDLVMVLVGCLIAWSFAVHQTQVLSAASPLPPPWSWSAGITVLLRGGAIGLILSFPAAFIGMAAGVSESVLGIVVQIVAYGPLLSLAFRHLFLPSGLGLLRWSGLRLMPGRWRVIGLMTLAGYSITSFGELALDSTGTFLGFSMHWTEWFMPELVWGGWFEVLANVVAGIVVAPVLEELVFRGLLFGTLRRHYGWVRSAAISAAIFASLHGYGLLGWLSIWWVGMVTAWMYEKTRSLLPGIFAHGLSNLLAFASVLLLRVP